MENSQTAVKKTSKMASREKSRMIFYVSLLIISLFQFVVCYIYVNINTIRMAFWNYEINIDALGYTYKWAGFKNFASAAEILLGKTYMIWNSVKFFLLSLLLSVPLSLMFSFYLYKKYPLAGLFKVVLFLPQIISGLIFSLLFKYIVTDVYIYISDKLFNKEVLGLFDNMETRYGAVMFFNIWISFGINTLMFSGSMSGIGQEIVEASEIDGVNIIQEFLYITLPLVYPTICSIIIIMTTGIFTNQMELFSIFGAAAEDIGTLGYYLFVHSQLLIESDSNKPSYSEMAALGFILTLIMVPVTLLLRKLLYKVGPSED